MSKPIADYVLLSNLRCAALVDRSGSLDWLCAPRFDAPSCFTALLGDARHGRWQLAPAARFSSSRHYLEDSLVLETRFDTDTGSVVVRDCMPLGERVDVVRCVRCTRGVVDMQLLYNPRCDYGSVTPRFSMQDDARLLTCVAGPDAWGLRSDEPLQLHEGEARARFTVRADETRCFTLTWHASHEPLPAAISALSAIADCEHWWREWSARCNYRGRWRGAVMRSLITLKALTYQPTGAVMAAATTSLPEVPGGRWNWDYRHCWLRDSTFTLDVFLSCGYRDEAMAWHDWLLRAVAGHLADVRPLYNLAGSCRISEENADWLPGYRGSQPVRIGNAAARQRQMDLHGQLVDTMHRARSQGVEEHRHIRQLRFDIIEHLDGHWREPDSGIWELRGEPRHYTHSKVMAWVAYDRAVTDAQKLGLDAPIESWQRTRDAIHADVCANGVCPRRGCFVQSYGSDALDASALLFAPVGFLPARDPRIIATVDAIQRELTLDGLPYRFDDDEKREGGGECAFLPCAFWLVDNLHLCGRRDEALALFERLLSLRNDVGLLSEGYSPQGGELLGNFPLSLSHLALINTARQLENT